MNIFHGTKNEKIQKFKPIATVPLLGRRPLNIFLFLKMFFVFQTHDFSKTLKYHCRKDVLPKKIVSVASSEKLQITKEYLDLSIS